MKIGNVDFDFSKKTYIMGILNMTPDSFSDGGKYNEMDMAKKRVETMILEGAHIIDIGGESTRPGHNFVPDDVEIQRVIPIIREIKSEFNIPVSLDTYKASVARAGIDAGADLINDVWGLKFDSDMAAVIAKGKKVCCLMHNRANSEYNNFMEDLAADLAETIKIAEDAGIEDDKIILDPGVGFGKTYQHNLEVMSCMEKLHMFGYPLLLGASRKSVIGLTLDLPVDQRVEGTIATSVIAVMKGCAFVRVHDIKENARAIKMAEAIKYC